MASVIERMIDKVTGYNEKKADLVTLCCPKCHKEKTVLRDVTDPPNAKRIHFHCADCRTEDSEVTYSE